MAVNYSILTDVELNTKSIKSQLKKIEKEFPIRLAVQGSPEVSKAFKQIAKESTETKTKIKDFGEEISKTKKELDDFGEEVEDTSLSFQAANEVFSKTISIIESMVEKVYKLDSALVEFRKVSDLSGEELDNYVNKLGKLGATVSRTSSEMLEGATEFRKNGFNDEDAAVLGTIAAQFQNVSDETISAGEASSFIISQLIAFNIEAENASKILDSVNEVANNFSVSSGDLAQALKIVASTSSVMGNSMEETLGIVTAITEQTKNASKASRGANAIFASLAQVLDDTSSNGKKITEIFESLGLELYDENKQLKSAFDLLKDLASVWNGLDSNTQKYIATTIAGETMPLQGVYAGTHLEPYILNYNRNIIVA